MGRYGGFYLEPTTFINQYYKRSDFHDDIFWKKEQGTWGQIIQEFTHKSFPRFKRNGIEIMKENNAKVLISTDGLLVSHVPDFVISNDEALTAISHHLNSFLGVLSFGGIFFHPCSEKTIGHINCVKGSFSLTTIFGDDYSMGDLSRTICRYKIPYKTDTQMIDSKYVPSRILTSYEFESHHLTGRRIADALMLDGDSQVMALEAFSNYTLHKWNNALILGWSFIEILLDKLWREKILSGIAQAETGRRERLRDYRTYSSSVKIEILYTINVISQEVYLALNSIRKNRNEFVHEGRPVLKEDAHLIFDSINKLIYLLTGNASNFKDPGWIGAIGWIDEGTNISM